MLTEAIRERSCMHAYQDLPRVATVHYGKAQDADVAASKRILPSQANYSSEAAESDSTCTVETALA